MSDARIVSFTEEGRPIYRASAMYNCLSVLVAARLGLEPNSAPDWMEERYQQGHDYEDFILDRARTRGMIGLHSQQMELEQSIGPAILRGHIDALGTGAFIPDTIDGVKADGPFGAEIDGFTSLIDAKAFAPSTWEKWVSKRFDAFPYYAWSMTIYQTLLKSQLGFAPPIVMAIGLKNMEAANEGRIVLDDFRLDVFTEPPMQFGTILQRILQVEKVAAGGIDNMPGKCDRPQWPCPYVFYPFHSGAEKEEIDPANIEGGLGHLAVLADRRNEAYRQMKECEGTVATLDEAMKSAVGEAEGSVKVGKMARGVSSVTFYHSNYTTVDWDKIQADYPGFDRSKYQTSRPSTKLSVRVNPKREKKQADVAS